MNCLFCSGDTRVTNSRPQKRTNSVWRRRECLDCGTLFTSNEAIDLGGSIIVKSGGHLEPFSRDKLFASLLDSLKHRKTAVADATALTYTILNRIIAISVSPELPKSSITRLCQETLSKFDTAAATHYAAFHLASS